MTNRPKRPNKQKLCANLAQKTESSFGSAQKPLNHDDNIGCFKPELA